MNGRRRRYIVEMQPPHTERWYEMTTYNDREEAEMNAKLIHRRVPAAKVRVRDTEEDNEGSSI